MVIFSSVGFEMYCRLLEEAVETLQTGKEPEKVVEPIIELKEDALFRWRIYK